MTIASDEAEIIRETAPEPRKVGKPKRRELTCSEAEVEALLSEGEFT